MNKVILKALVGSKAHGLDTPKSDTDTKSVFVIPTSNLLSLGQDKEKPKYTGFYDGMKDDTAYEVGYFLYLATKSNPTILETMCSPIIDANIDGFRVRDLFEHVWSSRAVKDAFIGYGLSQRKRFFETEDNHRYRFAVAWLRNLYQATELISTGTLPVRIADTPIGDLLRRWKDGTSIDGGLFTTKEVEMYTSFHEKALIYAYENSDKKETNYEPINNFLLDVRKRYFNE